MRRFTCLTNEGKTIQNNHHQQFEHLQHKISIQMEKKRNIAFVNPYSTAVVLVCVCVCSDGLCTFVVVGGDVCQVLLHTDAQHTLSLRIYRYCCVCASLLIFHEIHLAKENLPQFHSVFPNSLMRKTQKEKSKHILFRK